MTAFEDRKRQQGAALVIVLLLVATLSFIVLAISETVTRAADRSIGFRARNEALWRAVGTEALAAAAIEAAFEENPERLTAESPFLAAPLEIPMEGGEAEIYFADRTRCFNLNSLVRGGPGQYAANESSAVELEAILTAAGAGAASSSELAASVIDWIDEDSVQSPGGAENNYYTARPTPYSTGSTLLADASEVRALADIDREFYRALRPWVCALPTTQSTILNVNMLTQDDAPFLVGLTRGELSASAARDVILNRPPGGYASPEAFWAAPEFEALNLVSGEEGAQGLQQRVGVTSNYVGARMEVKLGDSDVQLESLFEVDGQGKTKLLSRRLGWLE